MTPARDEAANLRRLARCVERQTLLPSAWVSVDDGSVDGSAAVARALSCRHSWVQVVVLHAAEPDSAHAVAVGRRDGRPLRAFKAGIAAISRAPDVVVKLDADVTLPPCHPELLVAAFASDPLLGIASGSRYEWSRGAWRQRHLTGMSVEAQCRAYRRAALDDVLPTEARFCWDAVDVVKANLRGWRTQTVAELPFHHHRPMGRRDGPRRRAWSPAGGGAHYLGYRPTYVLLRTLFRACREPSALAMLAGYASATRRPPARAAADVRAHVRRGQRLRELRTRAREARGRGAGRAR